MGLIQSNAISAADAINELVSVDTSSSQNQQVSFLTPKKLRGWKMGKK